MRMKRFRDWALHSLLALCVMATSGSAGAETARLRVAHQLGLGFLPIYIMQANKLIEKNALASGINLNVEFITLASPATLNDMLLAGEADIAAAGFPPFMKIWDKTRGSLDIRSLGALTCQPLLLLTNKASVAKVSDFTLYDRIAVPAVKVSTQALYLQMLASRLFGDGEKDRFDTLTVGLPHPEAIAALIGGKTEITGYFSSLPFQNVALKSHQIRSVFNSYELTGGPSTTTLTWAGSRFVEQNPKVAQAFAAALAEAQALIRQNPAEAVSLYLKFEHLNLDTDEIVRIVADPEVVWSVSLSNTKPVTDFMTRVGFIRNAVTDPRDLLFPFVDR
jgi:NitT/TauT family transport system substrate-binding protein